MGLYYFTSDGEKIANAHIEKGEGALRFATDRDPRAVAQDFAFEELQRGNVCLSQAEADLKEAIRSKQILKLCHKLYKEDIADAEKRAKEQKLKAEYMRCAANVEARESKNSLRIVLSFRAQVVMQERLPSSLKRAGFREEEKGWALPTREAPLGDAAPGWKGALKNGSCGLGQEALTAFLDRYLAQQHEAKALAHCRNSQMKMADYLGRLQRQFKQYVPDEWLKENGRGRTEELLTPAAFVDTFASLKECKNHRQATANQLRDLRKLSARMADEHEVPALDPENLPGARALASEDLD